MADDKDVLLAMFKHYMDQGLYHQSQRATTTNIILILSGLAIGLINLDKNLEGPDDVSAAVSLIILGLFGYMWSKKYHERYAYYLQRARGYRDALNRSLPPNIDMKEINRWADYATKQEYGRIHRLRVWRLWTTLYMLIAVSGAVILAAIGWIYLVTRILP